MLQSYIAKKAVFNDGNDNDDTTNKDNHTIYVYRHVMSRNAYIINHNVAVPISHCCRQLPEVSNINRTLVGHETVDHSDVVGASPVGVAPTTSLFSI